MRGKGVKLGWVGEGEREGEREGGKGYGNKEATSHSAKIPTGLLACLVSQRAVSAAWGCCRQLSEMCDSLIVALMASPSLWR